MKYLRKSQMPFYALGFYALASISTAQASISEVQKLECAMISHEAEMIMEFRQYNMPMRDAINSANTALAKQMVEEAYRTRRYNSFEVQQDTIKDFGNKYYQACYNAAKEAEVNYED